MAASARFSLPRLRETCRIERQFLHQAEPRAGDILVTKVANHYHIGRVQAEGVPLVTIDGANDREVALMFACRLVTGTQRVFLCALASKHQYVEIDCAKPVTNG